MYEYDDDTAADELPPPDTLPPVVILFGDAHVQLTQLEPYQDDGAWAEDVVDGVVAVSVTGVADVDTALPTASANPWQITYDAVDAAGNRAVTLMRTVTVVALCASPSFLCEELRRCATCMDGVCLCLSDTAQQQQQAPVEEVYVPPVDSTPPVITLLGGGERAVIAGGAAEVMVAIERVLLGQPWADAGATAMDATDGAVTVAAAGAAEVNTAIVTHADAPYVVRYSAADAAGNRVEARRRVYVLNPCGDGGEVPCLAAMPTLDSPTVCSEGGLCLTFLATSEVRRCKSCES